MSRLCGGMYVTSRPPNEIVPEVGRMKPPRMPSSVVLPEPDGPSSETNSPAPTLRETSSRARTAPYALLADLISTLSARLSNDQPRLVPCNGVPHCAP